MPNFVTKTARRLVERREQPIGATERFGLPSVHPNPEDVGPDGEACCGS